MEVPIFTRWRDAALFLILGVLILIASIVVYPLYLLYKGIMYITHYSTRRELPKT